jgi:hypothetical protein
VSYRIQVRRLTRLTNAFSKKAVSETLNITVHRG